MHQVKKGNQWYFGMKAHIGVDAQTGLVHSVATTAANVADVTQVPQLLHGGETRVWGDAGYEGVARRPEHRGRAMDWQVARRPGQRRRLAPGRPAAQAEQRKASIRAKVEHPFLYVKRHFGYAHRAVSRIGQEPDPALLVAGVRQSAAGGARRARMSGRAASRAGAGAACTAARRGAAVPKRPPPAPPGALPLPRSLVRRLFRAFLGAEGTFRPLTA